MGRTGAFFFFFWLDVRSAELARGREAGSVGHTPALYQAGPLGPTPHSPGPCHGAQLGWLPWWLGAP